jgi:hypothetical protein
MTAWLGQVSTDMRDGYRTLLSTLAGLSKDDVQLSAAQRWRLTDLCDFLGLLRPGKVSVPDFRAAVRADSEQTREIWVRSMTVAAGIDLALLAEEARAALKEIGDGSIDPVLHLLQASPGERGHDLDLGRLNAEDRSAVLDLLTAQSDWIAESAAQLIWDAGRPGPTAEIAVRLRDVSPPRRFLLAALCCVVSAEPAAQMLAFFESTDPALRRAAAFVSRDVKPSPQILALKARALLDADATVRVAAGATTFEAPDLPPPDQWSCRSCANLNEFHVVDCPSCSHGTRPCAGDD